MIGIFYTFSKRHNSTALPTGEGYNYQIVLKDSTSILNPEIELGGPIGIPTGTANPVAYNYCYIQEFNRYYFVGDWTYDRNFWSASLSVDLLGSHKAYIKQTTAQVLYSASSYNLDLMDNRIAAAGTYDRQNNEATFVGFSGGAQVTPKGYFALTTLSNTSVWATGVTTTYFLTYQQMQLFARDILEPTAWDKLKQFFTNPMDGIIDCYYLPIDVTQYVDLTVDGPIAVGDYISSAATGKKAAATNLAVKSKSATIEIPWRYNDFRRLAPYTDVSLFVPYCGSKSLDPGVLYDLDKLFVDYSVDVNTGAVQAIAYVKSEVLEEFSGNMKVSLPLAQTQSRVENFVGAAGGALTAIGGIASGQPILIASGVQSAISSVVTQANQKVCGAMSGSVLGAILGNDVTRWQEIRLTCTSRDTSDTPEGCRATMGNALAKVVSLAGLTGYVQTSGASVTAPIYESELLQINQMLDGGIYLV